MVNGKQYTVTGVGKRRPETGDRRPDMVERNVVGASLALALAGVKGQQ